MGMEDKPGQLPVPSPQNQGAKGPGDGQGTQDGSKKKGGKKEAKSGQQDDTHKCCGCRFPLLVALLQLILGVCITVLAFLMAASCSSLLVRDTPHWAGIIVSAVAILGFFMLCLRYQPDEKTSCQFALKLAYFLLSALSLIVCVLAVAFASYHYSNITKFACELIERTCQCTLDSSDPLSRTFLYQDVTDCSTVTSTLKLYVLLQMTLNLLLALVCLAACFVMWKDRYQVFYAGMWLQGSATTETQQHKV
ncbi:sarcospan [Bombina bombina]|uniref:sarcospan n=1 Tax=Bombina bombina TaxID=8345 RepID=UPI00235B2733|nr:sarcospan [Bombina bombina]